MQAKGEATSANSTGSNGAAMTGHSCPALSLNGETSNACVLTINAHGFPQRVRYWQQKRSKTLPAECSFLTTFTTVGASVPSSKGI